MKHLFSPQGQQSLSNVMQLQPLLAFDFDGTLAPIVPRPDDAKVSVSIAHKLRHLSEHLPVAIVTGRSIADVRPRLGFDPAYVVGNHGAEDPFDTALDTKHLPHIEQLNWLRHKVSVKTESLLASGVTVEDKLHSIALHYRLAKDRAAAIASIESILSGIPPELRIFGGKCVVNVVSDAAPDKGKAVQHLLHRTGRRAAVFVG
ncbi:MAG TPA: trehalose-phosphatase, partial [Aquabacterium sp.]|nr:trehalose-phosphatase [Aquabacterium sp.]